MPDLDKTNEEIHADAPAKKRGRPKGSKNQPKSPKEKSEQPVIKRRPGRPKGSKNRPKPTGQS